eukprot:15466709-Alexandrium_andersonii.AAC.1
MIGDSGAGASAGGECGCALNMLTRLLFLLEVTRSPGLKTTVGLIRSTRRKSSESWSTVMESGSHDSKVWRA